MTETFRRKHDFDVVHGAQEVFRVLLEALANPGRVLSIRRQAAQFTGQGQWLAPALTLLDGETGFFWDGDPETGEEIHFLTGAPMVSLEDADFVFLSGGKNFPGEHSGPVIPEEAESLHATAAGVLDRVKGGTHLDPHDAALLFIAGERWGGKNSGGAAEQVWLKGPGVPPEGRRIEFFPAEAIWRRALEKRGFEYPCGVELIFLREDGSLMALTRKTQVLWDGPSSADTNYAEGG
jgi:alpha-D-ribose 1-methylphosphonate 5-triphosphate synthase subunit PhnH